MLIGAKILIFLSLNVNFYRKIEHLEFIYNNWLKGHKVAIQVFGNNEMLFDIY